MRYVPPSRLWRDPDDNVIGFLPAAFEHKPGEMDLSVNWLEYFGGTHASNVQACIADVRGFLPAKKAKFGVAKVTTVERLAQHSSKPVRIVYAPTDNNLSHSEIQIPVPVPPTVHADLALEFYKEHY